MFIKMDSYGKNISAYAAMPSGIRHKGSNVYVDGYGNIYLEFTGNATPIYRCYNGDIDQVGNVKIYYSYDRSTNQVGSYKVYHADSGKVIEINGVRF